MKITVEISHYPLLEDYEVDILQFIEQLHTQDQLLVVSNSMSTYIKGDYHIVMSAISQGLESVFARGNLSSTVLKIIPRDLPIEEGWLSF